MGCHYAAGDGLKKLVKDLNARGVPKPRTGKRGTGSWSTSSIHAMLRNERYRGVLTWGRREKAYRGGTKVRLATDASRWIVSSAPELRIVSDETWFAVQARIAEHQRGAGPKGGRPFRHMLSGLLRCSECGGPLTVTNHKIGRETVQVYTCAYHRDRGDGVCRSTARRPTATVNAAVVEWIRANVLSEEIVLEALKVVRARLEERTAATATELPALEKRATALRAEIGRLVEALSLSDEKPAPIVEAIAKRQTEASELEARLRAAKAAPSAISLEVRRLEKEARARVAALGRTLDRNPDEARALVLALFPTPLTATLIETPKGRRFQIQGEAAVGAIFAVDDCSNGASPTGFESPFNFIIWLVFGSIRDRRRFRIVPNRTGKCAIVRRAGLNVAKLLADSWPIRSAAA